MALLLPGSNSDGPDASAMFAYATVLDGLYHQDVEPARVYGLIAGAQVLGFRVDPSTYEPDYVVVGDGSTAAVIFGGTTNIPQWFGHAGSALAPGIDTVVDKPTVLSFFYGLSIREPEILNLLVPYLGKTIICLGHSYGGAAANILATHLQQTSPQTTVYVLTWGEPKSYGSRGLQPKPWFKARIVAVANNYNARFVATGNRDPVTMMPPAQIELIALRLDVTVAKALLGLGFVHNGQEWPLYPDGRLTGPFEYPWIAVVPFVELTALTGQVAESVYLHLMDTSYLAACTAGWQASGQHKELQPLYAYALGYIGNPVRFPDTTGPPLTAAQLNQAWMLAAGTITEANRTDFATVNVAAMVEIAEEFTRGATFLGGGSMPATLIPITFKGTFHFVHDNEGTSESYFYTGNPTGFGYGQMLQKMKALWPFRTQLSMCNDNAECTNPFGGVAVTVQNEQIFRDAVTTSMAGWPNVSYIAPNGPIKSGNESTTVWGKNTYNNDTADSVWKGQFLDGQGHEAQQFFHGVPLFSQRSLAGLNQQPQPNQGQRYTEPQPAWIKALNNFCNQLVALELGFRYTWRIWEPAGIKTPDYPTGAPPTPGNSTPLAAFYNLPGLPPNCYTFTMPQSTLATALTPYVQVNSKGRYRVIVRGMKALDAINGRWPAIGWTSAGPPAGYTQPYPAAGQFCITVIRRASQVTWDAQGDVCPEAWSAMIPLQAVPPANSPNPPGVANIILGSKKTGRPFGLQRGKSAIRKT